MYRFVDHPAELELQLEAGSREGVLAEATVALPVGLQCQQRDTRPPNHSGRPVHVAIVSTFPPRHCGIATFSCDLHESLEAAPGIDRVSVIAIAGQGDVVHPPPVVGVIGQEVRADYPRAARLVGRLGIDAVIIEHEYGIFGGRDGEYLLSFTGELSVPFAICLHTVLSEPTAGQDRVLRELFRRAAAVLVFTDTACEIVTSDGVADPGRVHVVPHGAPREISEIPVRGDTPRATLQIHGRAGAGPTDTRGRFVLASFGLISPGKGLETAIDAVARIAARHPQVLLLIAGQTHPEILRRDGERYRLSLERRIRELGLTGHVSFDDRFLTVGEISQLLAATDVFVTTYRSREQAVSGALSFALAAGCPAVSTPYPYAEDMLAGGAGLLVPFDDPEALAEAVTELLEHPGRLAAARREARRVGATLSWPEVGRATAQILLCTAAAEPAPEAPLVTEHALPPLRFHHLRTLVDDVGIVQHATDAVPNRH